jgi:hypothetical protein
MESKCPERGFGAAVLLVFLSAAALGLAMLAERGGLGLARAGLSVGREQARHLAHAGVEHALWRVQHEPCFLEEAAGTTFTRAWGDGEYAYSVRGGAGRIEIAAVGTAGDARWELQRIVDRRPSADRAMLVHAPAGLGAPVSQEYVLGAWSAASPTDVVTRDVRWTTLVGTQRRQERLLATLDANHRLELQLWNADGWRRLATLATDVEDRTRGFDVAYESTSGDGLVVHRAENDDAVYSRTVAKGALGAPQHLDLPFTSTVKWLTLVPRPGKDEISFLAIGDGKTLAAGFWNGDAFGPVRILDTDLASDDFEVAAGAFLDPSGAALVTWTSGGALHAALWSGLWVILPPVPLPLGEIRAARLVAHPGTGSALLALLSEERILGVATWNAGGWSGGFFTVTSDASTEDSRCFDLAIGRDGRALLVYGEASSSILRARVWTPGSGWSGVLAGPDAGGPVRTVQVRADGSSDLLHVAAAADAPSGRQQLRLATWKAAWSAGSLISNSLPGSMQEGFMVCTNGGVCADAPTAVVP